uniref:cNMP binding protein n=2 Tax=Pristionchus pacificus TaxID=54126 RepID=A0A8R1YTX5_PRIPA
MFGWFVLDGYSLLFITIVVGLITYFFRSSALNPQRKPSDASNCCQEGWTENGRRSRRVSTIREGDDESGQATLARPKTLESAPRRMRKRDWIKKTFKSLVSKSPNGTPSDDSNEGGEGGGGSLRKRSEFRRRHSSAGPLQFAKDLVRGRRGYFRQTSELLNRDALPRPPVEFFEPTDLPEIPQNLSPEIFYVLHNLKMLELPSIWKLDPKDIEVFRVEKGETLARPGDTDNSIFVPLTGCLAVYIAHEGKEYMVKQITKGNNFFSLLSMLDVLMESESVLRTVSVRSCDAGLVAKYNISSFVSSYREDPKQWIRPIQIVVTRLLHVTMTTLHHYMGLSAELMRDPRADRICAQYAAMHGSTSQTNVSAAGYNSGSDEVGGVASRLRHASGHSVKLTQAGRPKFNRAQSTIDGSISGPVAATAHVSFTSMSDGDKMTVARRWFAEAMGMGPGGEKHVENRFTLLEVPEGSVIVEQGSDEERLFLVLSGKVALIQEPVFDNDDSFMDESEEDRYVVQLHQREMFGGLQMLTQEPAFYTFKAAVPTCLAMMEKTNFAALCDAHPRIYLPVAHSVLRRLSPFVRGVDFALDWVLVDSGQAVYRANDLADSLYVVLSGRLRSVEKKTVMEEFGRGDMIGMMEVLQHRPRSTTVLAVRFSQLAKIPEGLLNFVKMTYPQVGFRIVQLLGQYYSSVNRRATGGFIPNSMRSIDAVPAVGDPMSHIKNLHTIAVVPATPDVPLVAFTCELYHALSANLRVLRLSSTKVAAHLDKGVLEKQADFRLMHWLNVQEDTYPLVIYECDYTASNWTRRCLRQADAILVVALGNQRPPKQSFMEEQFAMTGDGIRTNKELILLWPEDTVCPNGTYEWLKCGCFSGHHHIRAPGRMFQWNNETSPDVPVTAKTPSQWRGASRDDVPSGVRAAQEATTSQTPTPVTPVTGCTIKPLSVTETEVVDFYEQNVLWESVDHRSDFARLARILTGNAIGLVLGGGGARGAAHVGVIRALREAGVPVDIVGGTSIGSMIGGLFAESPNASIEERARSWFEVMCSFWRKLLDLTWAHSAMFTGAQFNQTLKDLFDDREIEDLWLPYFCISTDISTSEMRVHRSGPLWAYCRASMSLAGYLPPLCDPSDGHLLLDGGYVNNLPADVMRSMGARVVIAVDVGSAEEMNLYNYGDRLNGWWAALRAFNPWGSDDGRILNNQEIQSRLAYVSCVRQLEIVKKASYCHYLRPDIEKFMTLEFSKYDVILDVGLNFGRAKLQDLLSSPHTPLSAALGERAKLLSRRQSRRKDMGLGVDRSLTSSFTDLAAQASKIPRTRQRRQSLTALDNMDEEDLYLCDSEEGEYAMSSDFAEASESEEEGHRITTPRPVDGFF